jgi:antitoxin VapB
MTGRVPREAGRVGWGVEYSAQICYIFRMINLSQDIEALIKAKAARTGQTPDELLREALAHTGDVLAWRSSVAPPPANLSKDELIAGMEAIAARCAARPVADPRSIDEIIGYDDFGLPR